MPAQRRAAQRLPCYAHRTRRLLRLSLLAGRHASHAGGAHPSAPLPQPEPPPPHPLPTPTQLSFPFIGLPDLRAVPLAVLDRLRPVPAAFLKQLPQDPELFRELPVGVQRQVWVGG